MDPEYTLYTPASIPIDKRISTLSLSSKQNPDTENSVDYAINRFSQKYDSYQEFLYRNRQQQQQQTQQRSRLSSTGEGSSNGGDSSSSTTTTASGSIEDGTGSEGRAESDDTDMLSNGSRCDRDREEGNCNRKLPLEGQITEMERQQVETFFKGLKTQIYVCGSLANLYTKSTQDEDWQLKYTGIPVVILDVGESRARNKRRIQIALAERGTSFMLWRDTIDNLSSYKVETASFHTMCYSCDHTTKVGFSFDTAEAAQDMWLHVEQLVACPENISLSTPGKKKKKKEKKKQIKPAPLPPKSHISQPCCFQHITSVDREDTCRYFSFKELLPL